MFVLEILEDKVKAQPDQFDRSLKDIIMEQIELKYVNKIIFQVGLCVAFYDFLHIGDPLIYPAEGSTHQTVKFRIVVFRPFDGETLVGTIASSDEKGLTVSMGFFDDIFIPAVRFLDNSVYNEVKKTWVWKYGDPGEQSEFVYEINEKIRFKVLTVAFSNDEELRNQIKAQNSFKISIVTANHAQGVGAANHAQTSAAAAAAPPPEPYAMKIIGGISDFGLGLCAWW
jgi:DNA-directed RNA polymerase III subunit RPC8